MKKKVFFISDGTGITAEALGSSLITQFEQIQFDLSTIPYVNSPDKAREVVKKINNICHTTTNRPLAFTTLVNPEIRTIFQTCDAKIIDFFATFLEPLEEELGYHSNYQVGKSHGMSDFEQYQHRIEAVNYTLGHDDGIRVNNYTQADIILIGVSRCGKTPSCLYLALQFGILAANYPITEEDFIHNHLQLPKILRSFKKKLFGLTINPERLQAIRSERRPESRYASLKQCRTEINTLEEMYRLEAIPFLNTTHSSIEEIATMILAKTGIKRKIV